MPTSLKKCSKNLLMFAAATLAVVLVVMNANNFGTMLNTETGAMFAIAFQNFFILLAGVTTVFLIGYVVITAIRALVTNAQGCMTNH